MTTVAKPQRILPSSCESCQRASALIRQTLPDGESFQLCQRCVSPVEGAVTRMLWG